MVANMRKQRCRGLLSCPFLSVADVKALLLRDCALEEFAGVAIDEGQTEIGGGQTQAANDALAVPGIARGGSSPSLSVRETRSASVRAVAVIALALPTR